MMSAVLKGYLRLMRPANLPTAAADILAGVAIAGVFKESDTMGFDGVAIAMLVVASVLMYAGGVVLNDVFDFEIDTAERPERPIPSGSVSLKSAAVFGTILLFLGVLAAFLVGVLCGYLALALAVLIFLYDSFSKKHEILGPLNMGLCRSVNLLLGIAVLGSLNGWSIASIPLVYIIAVTTISRGEVHGDNKKQLIWASILYALALFGVLGTYTYGGGDLGYGSVFLAFLGVLIYIPLWKAYRENTPERIKKAVISGVLSIIVLDASIAVGHTYWWYGLLILLLLPLSIALSKLFAVT